MSERLSPQPGEIIDRSKTLRFTWNDKAYSGFAGDSIASALAASGVTIFSRSMKYHRPRGLLTADYWDPNCIVQVGDEPNVRAAHRRLERVRQADLREDDAGAVGSLGVDQGMRGQVDRGEAGQCA